MEKLDCLNLNGRLLRLFITIYEKNSVGLAAKELGLNQSTVSYSLDKLRAYLRDPLFLKYGRSITPTERAIMLAPRIRSLLAKMESLASLDIYDPETDDRPITMAANTLHLLPQWPRIYRQITKEAPQMPVRMLELGSRENINGLLTSGRVDLVFGVRPSVYPAELDVQEAVSEPQVCFFDPKVRGPLRSVEDYFAARHGVLDFGSGNTSLNETSLRSSDSKRKITLYAPNIEALATLIEGTDQIASFQQGLIYTAFKHFEYCEPPIELPRINIDMMWHRRDENSGRSRWIRNLVNSCLAKCNELENPMAESAEEADRSLVDS